MKGKRSAVVGMAGFATIGTVAVMLGNVPAAEPRNRTYREPLGPPYPATRQQRRAMERQARKGLK